MKQVSPAEIRAVNPAVYSVEEETGLFSLIKKIMCAKRIDQEYDFHLLPVHDLLNTNKMLVVYINWDSHFRWPFTCRFIILIVFLTLGIL